MKLELSDNCVNSCSPHDEACPFKIDEQLAMQKRFGDLFNFRKQPLQRRTIDFPVSDDNEIVRSLECLEQFDL